MSSDTKPMVRFEWGTVESNDVSALVEQTSDGLEVVLHPGLSSHQVNQVAQALGEHGPALIQAWTDFTGFSSFTT